MLEGPPVEVGAPEVNLAIVHDEVLGVLNAAEGRLDVPSADLDEMSQPIERGRILVGEHGVDEEPYGHASARRGLDRLEDGLEGALWLGGDVELRDVQPRARALDHRDPRGRRVRDRRRAQRRIGRDGFDERDGGYCERTWTEAARRRWGGRAGQRCQSQQRGDDGEALVRAHARMPYDNRAAR